MFIRHGEKPTGQGPPYGVSADGEHDPESLTVTGWTRAGALVGLFDPRAAGGDPVALRPGLTRPVTVLAAAAGRGSNSQRPAQTVTPLAAALAVPVNPWFGVGQEAELAGWLTGPDGPAGPTLIAWEHKHLPVILTALGPITPGPPRDWPDDRFDIVYVLTATADTTGWTFAQVPQMLLAGDSPTPIS
jgi:hypothetical protein